MDDKCPRCGALKNETFTALDVWMCGSNQIHDMAFNDSTCCLRNQLANQQEKVERLIVQWQEKLATAEEAASDAWMHRDLASKDIHEHATNVIRRLLLDLAALTQEK